MKKLSILVIGISIFASCSSPSGQVYVNQPSQNDVTVNPTNLGANLDLQALGEIVKSSQDAKDIEQKLNAQGSINNLDLDGDGNVDYITVTEYGDQNTRGFSFTVDLGANGKQEVATVTVDKSSNQANMSINGNQAVYGSGVTYNASYPLTDLLIASYLFSYHPYYVSPWHYGYYPSYYRSYRYTPYGSYRSRMSNSYSSSRIRKTTTTTTTRTIKSPNSSYSSNSTVSTRSRSLSNPTSSQKSFSSRPSGSSTPKVTGFGKSSSPSSSSRSTSSPSRSSSSSRSFGSNSRTSSSSSSSRSSGRRR